jgi:hypothetical protein
MIGLEGSGFTICLGIILLLTGDDLNHRTSPGD